MPDRPCQIQGDRVVTWARLRPPGQRPRRRPPRRRPRPTRARWPPTSTTAPSTSRPTSPPSRAASRRSTPTTATGPRRSSTSSTTPTPRPSSSTPPSPSCSTASAAACRRCAAGTAWPTAPRRCPTGRVDYETVVEAPAPTVSTVPWGRSADDLLLLYTGGTTGMPKGVMWRQDDLFNVLGARRQRAARHAAGGHVDRRAGRRASTRPAPASSMLPACPLMHGTGQFSSLIAMNLGGAVVTLPSRKFSRRRAVARGRPAPRPTRS